MTCPHCCFTCTAKGTDMSRADFLKALELAKNYGQQVCIGGGEPTLHPEFKAFLMNAIYEMVNTDGLVDLTTNGSNTEIALTLASLAKKGIISCALSQDQYHDPIDAQVVQAFTKAKHSYYASDTRIDPHDARSIKNSDREHIAVGRGALLRRGYKSCACDSLFVAPSGMVYPCACRQTKLGRIGELKNLPDYLFHSNCERSAAFKEEKAEYETEEREMLNKETRSSEEFKED